MITVFSSANSAYIRLSFVCSLASSLIRLSSETVVWSPLLAEAHPVRVDLLTTGAAGGSTRSSTRSCSMAYAELCPGRRRQPDYAVRGNLESRYDRAAATRLGIIRESA